jgi:hypothetical protein
MKKQSFIFICMTVLGISGSSAIAAGTNNVLVLTTHLPIDDSSHEHATSGFQTHVLDLKAPGSACADANFELDLEGSAKNSAFDANYVWSIKGNSVEVEKVPASNLGDTGVESVVSFTILPILDAQKNPTNLCITVIDQI